MRRVSEQEDGRLTPSEFEAFVRENRELLYPALQRVQEKLAETTLGRQRWREIVRFRMEHSPQGTQLSYEEFISHQVAYCSLV